MHKRLWDVILIPDAFTPMECNDILSVMSGVPLDAATIKDGQASQARKSDVCFVEYDPEVWIFQKLQRVVEAVNTQAFHFNLNSWFDEGFQYTQYPEGGFYNWHTDIGAGKAELRKLSLVLQLNTDYDGGDLQFFPAQFDIPKSVGWVAAFPAYMPHRVTPVTRGTRHTLVTWVSGPTPFA